MRTLFVLLLLIFNVSYSQQWEYLDDFSGGLNTVDPPNLLSKNQALILKNAVVDRKAITKRFDFTPIAQTFSSEGVRASYLYYNGLSRETQIIAVAGNSGFISRDDGRTFTMFYSDSGYTVTNGSKLIVAPDSGATQGWRDLYFSGWQMKIGTAIYTVSSFGVSSDTDPDTIYLQTAYAGTSGGSKKIELSPTIASGYVDFETWLGRLYIADGQNPVKVWNGEQFRHENAKRYYPAVDSFKASETSYSPLVQGNRTFLIGAPTGTAFADYGNSHFQLIWEDSTGVGEEVSKPHPILEYIDNSGLYYRICGLSRYDIDTTKYIYVTYPADLSYAEYETIDSGTFERVVKVDSATTFMLYDFVDNQKYSTWTSTTYNDDATMIVFDDPDSDHWYFFRNYKRNTSPDTVCVRINLYKQPYMNAYNAPRINGDNLIDSAITHGTALSYRIIKLNFGSVDVLPSAQFVKQQADVMFYGRLQDAPSRVIVSDPGTDSLFSVEFNVGGEDGDVLTGLFPIYNYMFALKSDAIWQVIGNTEDNLEQQPQSYDFGVKSSQAYFQHRNSFVGFNQQGFFLFGSDSDNPFSRQVDTYITDSLNWEATQVIDGVDAGRFFALAMPTGASTVNNDVLTFDLQSGVWNEWTGLRVGSWLMNDKATTGDSLLYFDADSGMVYLYGRERDDDYDLIYQSPFLTGEDVSVEKDVTAYLIEGAWDYGDSLQVSLFVNSTLTAVQTDTVISTSVATKAKPYIRQTKGAVRGIDYSLRVTSLSCDTVSISRVGFYVTPIREMRR